MTRAGRIFVPLDVNWYEEWGHELSDAAALTWVVACARSKQMMSDGKVTLTQLRRIAPASVLGSQSGSQDGSQDGLADVVSELCAIGAWERCDDSAIRIRGWKTWNDTAAEVSQKVQSKRKAALLANHKRWHEARNVNDPRCPLCDKSGSQSGSQVRSQVRRQSESIETETETETIKKELSASAKRRTQVPEGWLPDEPLMLWAGEKYPGKPVRWLIAEAEHFVEFHRAKGTLFADVRQAYRGWLRNAVKWERPDPQTAPPAPAPLRVPTKRHQLETALIAHRRSEVPDADAIAELECELAAMA